MLLGGWVFQGMSTYSKLVNSIINYFLSPLEKNILNPCFGPGLLLMDKTVLQPWRGNTQGQTLWVDSKLLWDGQSPPKVTDIKRSAVIPFGFSVKIWKRHLFLWADAAPYQDAQLANRSQASSYASTFPQTSHSCLVNSLHIETQQACVSRLRCKGLVEGKGHRVHFERRNERVQNL